MLDDFAQVYANVSVLTIEGGLGYTMMFGRLDVLHTFSIYDIFKLQWVFKNITPL